MNKKESFPNISSTNLPEYPITRGRFDQEKVNSLLEKIYSSDKIIEMKKAGVDQRMIFGINPYYFALAVGGGLTINDNRQQILPKMPPSSALLALMMPRLGETFDLSGEEDSSNQLRYSPEELRGKIVHKYGEIVLGLISKACSAHCRYCFRLDLFNDSTGKGLVKPEELRDYVINYNKWVKRENNKCHNKDKHYPVTEIVYSGGDTMILSNLQIYKYLTAAAEAGVDLVRLATKELVFRPQRFDVNFVDMLKAFHENYPHVHINFVAHFTHPDEFLERNEGNEYIKLENDYQWLKPVDEALDKLLDLNFVTIDSQTPMIDKVNDNPETLRLLHKELRRKGIKFKYTFQCREIEGHRAFAVPLENAWKIFIESQRGLSDAARSRFAMSTESGKLEIVSIIDEIPNDVLSKLSPNHQQTIQSCWGGGFIIFKVHRSPYFAETLGDLIIAKRNPEALWISGYEDRIIYDGRKTGADKFNFNFIFNLGIKNLVFQNLVTEFANS